MGRMVSTARIRVYGERGADMASDGIRAEVLEIAQAAKRASTGVGQTGACERNAALAAMAAALREHADEIVAANAQDMEAARAAGTKESLLDRLMLDGGRVEDMASALEDLIALPDPLGEIQERRTLYNGIELERVSVPLGVVAVVYEARPNVTADAAGICLKAGNACVLRGGSLAARSNAAVSRVLHDAAVASGMPCGCIGSIASTDRAATDELMQLHGVIDVLVPRGGEGLIRHCVECSKVPVIETGTGNCHVYVHSSADPAKAVSIVENAKCRRYGVCNAAETLLIDRSVAGDLLPGIFTALSAHGVVLHCDPASFAIAQRMAADGVDVRFDAADESDWATEYLAPEIAVKCVEGVDEAIEHVNCYGTHHSEAIVAEDAEACERFLARADAAAVYANASTAFTDGGQFGMGAEIGISTQKLHARGPFALRALTSYKYILRGDGQVRA